MPLRQRVCECQGEDPFFQYRIGNVITETAHHGKRPSSLAVEFRNRLSR